MIEQVNPDRIPEIWDSIRGLVNDALKHAGGHWHERDVLVGLLTEQMHLWRAEGAIAITRMAAHPRSVMCEFFLVSGEGRENWLKYEAVIASWAREKGCKEMVMRGRKGWERILSEEWKFADITMKRAL